MWITDTQWFDAAIVITIVAIGDILIGARPRPGEAGKP
jgi:hypothetical protein